MFHVQIFAVLLVLIKSFTWYRDHATDQVIWITLGRMFAWAKLIRFNNV